MLPNFSDFNVIDTRKRIRLVVVTHELHANNSFPWKVRQPSRSCSFHNLFGIQNVLLCFDLVMGKSDLEDGLLLWTKAYKELEVHTLKKYMSTTSKILEDLIHRCAAKLVEKEKQKIIPINYGGSYNHEIWVIPTVPDRAKKEMFRPTRTRHAQSELICSPTLVWISYPYTSKETSMYSWSVPFWQTWKDSCKVVPEILVSGGVMKE